MNKKSKRKFLFLSLSFILSIVISILIIIHGVFIDLDISQISRFSIGGFIVTFVIVFLILLLLEWLFDKD